MAKKESNYYFDTFVRGADYANEASHLLAGYVENYDKAKLGQWLKEMHTVEHTADTVKSEMMERLVKEFLPPIEREDIVSLSHAIDEVTDCIEDALRRMYMYDIPTLRPDVKDFVEIILQSCDAMSEAMRELHDFRKSALLRQKVREISDLEEKADYLYTGAMRRLFTEESDTLVKVTWSRMYEALEKCCDWCEHVAREIQQVVLKNS